MTCEEDKALATQDFWDARYARSDGAQPTHEWFRSFHALEPFLKKHLFDQYGPERNPRILHLGSGDSTVPRDLAHWGYLNQLCVDFSHVVVDLMTSPNRVVRGVEWKWADVRSMAGTPDGSIDVSFDKGTWDAMIYGSPWDPPDDVKENTGRYIKEVFRVLADDGVFLYVTFRQPHFMRPLLNHDGAWDLNVEVLSDDESTFDYHGFIMKKPARRSTGDGSKVSSNPA